MYRIICDKDSVVRVPSKYRDRLEVSSDVHGVFIEFSEEAFGMYMPLYSSNKNFDDVEQAYKKGMLGLLNGVSFENIVLQELTSDREFTIGHSLRLTGRFQVVDFTNTSTGFLLGAVAVRVFDGEFRDVVGLVRLEE